MRLLHTSDWHLGRWLMTASLVEHQRAFLGWLADLADERSVDAILVSGDVYDRAIPSVDAVRLLEAALVDLVGVCPVILISGNHDSPTRLGFGGPLLESLAIHLRSSVDDIGRAIEIVGSDGVTVAVYGIPYLEPEVTRGQLGAEKSHEAVLTAAMERVRDDLSTRREHATTTGAPIPRAVVLSHSFIRGGSVSDSERDVSVGGIADAPATVFHGVDYVALGHLHGPQEIANPGGPLVRYSGSPIAYSFSEESHTKSVAIVDIDAQGHVIVDEVAAPVPRPLTTITGDLGDLLTDARLDEVEDHWIRAVVTDPRRPENAMDRLRSRFANAIELSWVAHVDGQPVVAIDRRVDPVTATPVEVVVGFIEHVTGQPASEEERRLADEAVERVRIMETSS
jgi:exonuclease SbcD